MGLSETFVEINSINLLINLLYFYRNRGLPFEESDCALNLMRQKLKPFDDPEQNDFDTTIEYSRPVDVFDYSGHLGYHYDNLELNGWNLDQLEQVLEKQR